jgi:hypothetical protein
VNERRESTQKQGQPQQIQWKLPFQYACYLLILRQRIPRVPGGSTQLNSDFLLRQHAIIVVVVAVVAPLRLLETIRICPKLNMTRSAGGNAGFAIGKYKSPKEIDSISDGIPRDGEIVDSISDFRAEGLD